ncbi:efflux RND transporter periplasmic adaptor subunit [Aestuariibacter sp. AA17]|uniref:Efflux RND transporter periplasmic adaptor subunit n=1 Tax=Fluctibacter corallii TaxID=2984329 RepID=A0ABT3A7Y5_9ALTE|nr:efflux RND transporter periplasmic adaptor subunit [Aestuariibacter sp. AA17]MCV2884790.1 efflux RND transporter periplasmic adaptor subunit [Aestuariibacter sp. AA17]
MSNSFKLSPMAFAVLALAGLLAYLNWPQAEAENARRGGATPVVVHDVKESEFEVIVEALGTAKANEAVTITAQKAEVVHQLHFDDGDRVEKDQLLLTLDNREENARVKELDVNLQEAKRQLKRVKDLANKSVASQQLLDEQEAKVKALKAQRDVARAKLEELNIRAPFKGKLGIRQVSVGAFVSPGDSITTLDDLSKIKVDFSISESHLPSLQIGQKVTAKTVAYPDNAFIGEIKSIDSRVDPITRSIQVRAIVDNPDYALRPGMLLQINLQKQVLNTLVVPEKALLPIEDKQFVFVIIDGKASKREVQVGKRKPGWVQIRGGLQEGEQVVVEGTLRLNDGAAVAVQSPDA